MKKNLIFVIISSGLFAIFSCADEAAFAPETSGKGGSMARFTIAKNHLYVVDYTSLKYFNISKALSPEYVGSIAIEEGIETVFSYGDNLFLGAMAGMHIFDIADPQKPERISVYRHIMSCDPVVVSGNYAYVTLRAGTACGGGMNVLDVINIADLKNPVLTSSHSMTGPYGLGVADTILFVCDGYEGLTIFNIKTPSSPVRLSSIDTIHGYDVIALPERKDLIVTGDQGIYQYDYSDALRLKFLSKISTESN